MQGMTRQKQSLLQFRRPSVAHPFEIFRTITRIKFVAYNRKPVIRQMHADLMHPAGLGKTTNHGMTTPTDFKSMLNLELREAFAARRMYHLPDPNRRRPEFTLTHNWLRIGPLIQIRPPHHDRNVFLLNLAPFKNDTKLSRCESVLGHQDKPARVTIQSVHDRRLCAILHFKRQEPLNPTKQGRLGLAIGRVHDQGRRLIYHKPIDRLVDHRKINHDLQAHPTKSHQPTPPRNLLLHAWVHMHQSILGHMRKRVACRSG